MLKPKKPAMTVETVSFLIVLMVVMPKTYGPNARPDIGQKMRLGDAL